MPPGYTPSRAYPVLFLLHTASVDEHFFVGTDRIADLDAMIGSGAFPPTIVAMPDGLIDGENRINGPHSFYLNGRFGRFEDHLLFEVMPFLASHYSTRPEPGAHGLLGLSGGGLGASSIAMRHPDVFGVVAVLSAPLNLRYTTCDGDSATNFDPATFRWKTEYDPDEVVGLFNFGLKRVPAWKHISPVFGDCPAEVFARVTAINPADLLVTATLAPGRPRCSSATAAATTGTSTPRPNPSSGWPAAGLPRRLRTRRAGPPRPPLFPPRLRVGPPLAGGPPAAAGRPGAEALVQTPGMILWESAATRHDRPDEATPLRPTPDR